MFTLDPMTLTLVVSVIIPLIVGIVTKKSASPEVKTVVNIVITGVMQFIANGLNEDGSGVWTQAMIQQLILGLVVSIAMYYGVYKPVDIPGKTAPNKGIG